MVTLTVLQALDIQDFFGSKTLLHIESVGFVKTFSVIEYESYEPFPSY